MQHCCNSKGKSKTLFDRVDINQKNFKNMQTNKEVLLAQILEEKSKTVGGTHCSNCGHCTSTL
ncbi:MAG: hypothetical protein CMO01_05925 [Thalassobius sp.]|nr:hypothetical protein [Thalassovita sp.]